MKTLTTLAWLGIVLAVLVELVLRLLHREMPTAGTVFEMVCAAVVLVTESINWCRRP